MPLNEEAFIARVSIRHSISRDAARTILSALRAGGGTMAQFSHADFGGMSQWSPGMTMVGDMFNNGLKSKLDAVCSELAEYVAETPSTHPDNGEEATEISYRSSRQSSDWWPSHLGTPSAVGGKMTFSMQFSRGLNGWRSETGAISTFMIRATIESSALPKRKGQTRR